MNISAKIAVLLLGMMVLAGCSKAPETTEQGGELDWSRTSTVTLGEVAIASATRAASALAPGQTFRLYALNPRTKAIIATRTYTIDAATAGKPMLDASQEEEIVLPFGEIEIYLVGPVKALVSSKDIDGNPITNEVEIAGPTEVTPLQGVDLISSKTDVLIEGSKTEITPEPLQHRMVKLAIEVSMVKDEAAGGTKATYQDASMTDPRHGIKIENLSAVGTFTFDDNGGSVNGAVANTNYYTYTVGNTGTGKIVLTTAAEEVDGAGTGFTGAVYTVTDYIAPSAATTPKLSVAYGYWNRTAGAPTQVEALEMSGKTPLPQAWAAGTYVKLSTTLMPSVEMTIRPQVLAWDDAGTAPEEPVNNSELLFWYSGEDGPETINGKLCWRDRSGNGNHAEIVGGMQHDVVNKCYYTVSGGHFNVPALGAVSEYTLELLAQSKLDANNGAVIFSGTNGIYLHLPYGNTVVWYNQSSDSGGTSTNYAYGNSDKYIFEQLNSYAFCRSQTQAAIVINGTQKVSAAKTGPWADFNDNTLWNTYDMSGTQRLYGVRMYKKYMNDATGRATLAQNYASKLSQLGVKVPVSSSTLDYVKDGLILDLRGETPLNSSPGYYIWEDKSGKGNHARVYGTFSTTETGKTFSGNIANYMKLVKSLGEVPEVTVEFVTESTNAGKTLQPLISAASNRLYPGVNVFAVWWPYSLVDGVLVDMPFHDTSYERIWIAPGQLINPVTTLSQLSASKSKANRITFWQNGYAYTNKATTNNMAIPELNNVYIGANADVNLNVTSAYQGKIYAVRIYNRALSDRERQHNYLVDKQKYNILP